jgi:hypothetical protein
MGGHLITNLSLAAGASEELARGWLIALHGLIRESLAILRTDRQAVQRAFSWLREDEEL